MVTPQKSNYIYCSFFVFISSLKVDALAPGLRTINYCSRLIKVCLHIFYVEVASPSLAPITLFS